MVAKWLASIAGKESDLTELAKSLVTPELRVIYERDAYFLESSHFDHFTTPEEVEEKANELLALVSGASRLTFGLGMPLVVSFVDLVPDNGPRVVYAKLTEKFAFRDTVTTSTTRADGRVEVFNPADQVPKLVYVAGTDSAAAEVLTLCGGPPNDWVNLYRIYEIVRLNVGGDNEISARGWATKSDLSKFRQTANSPEAIGKSARHGVQVHSAPTNPMSLSEARILVECIARLWLVGKT